jgi:hypothetical protein
MPPSSLIEAATHTQARVVDSYDRRFKISPSKSFSTSVQINDLVGRQRDRSSDIYMPYRVKISAINPITTRRRSSLLSSSRSSSSSFRRPLTLPVCAVEIRPPHTVTLTYPNAHFQAPSHSHQTTSASPLSSRTIKNRRHHSHPLVCSLRTRPRPRQQQAVEAIFSNS